MRCTLSAGNVAALVLTCVVRPRWLLTLFMLLSLCVNAWVGRLSSFHGTPEQIAWLASSQSASSLVVGFAPVVGSVLWLAGGSVKHALLACHVFIAVMSVVAVSMGSIPGLAAALFMRSLGCAVQKACEQVMWTEVDAMTVARARAGMRPGLRPKKGRRAAGGGLATGQREALTTVGGVVGALLTGYLSGIDVRLLFVMSAVLSLADFICVLLFWHPRRTYTDSDSDSDFLPPDSADDSGTSGLSEDSDAWSGGDPVIHLGDSADTFTTSDEAGGGEEPPASPGGEEPPASPDGTYIKPEDGVHVEVVDRGGLRRRL